MREKESKIEGGQQVVVWTAAMHPFVVIALAVILIAVGSMAAAYRSVERRVEEAVENQRELLAYVITLRESLLRAGFEPPPMEKEQDEQAQPEHPEHP